MASVRPAATAPDSPYARLLEEERRSYALGGSRALLDDLETGCQVTVHGYRARIAAFFAVVDPVAGARAADVEEWPAPDRRALYPETPNGRKPR